MLWWFWPDEPVQVLDGTRPAPVERVEEPATSELPDLGEELRVVGVESATSELPDLGEELRVVGLEPVTAEGIDVGDSGLVGQGDGALPDTGDVLGTGDEEVAATDGLQVPDPPAEAADPGLEPPAGVGEGASPPEALVPPLGDPTVPDPGEPPVIPDAAADGAARFMQGLWHSDSGLMDAQTKQKLTQEYTFGDQGRGEAVIRRADGVVCRAPAQATMKGGNLQVDELEHLACTDGSSFRRSQTVCTKGPSGNAECVGTDADGSRFKVELNRGSQP